MLSTEAWVNDLSRGSLSSAEISANEAEGLIILFSWYLWLRKDASSRDSLAALSICLMMVLGQFEWCFPPPRKSRVHLGLLLQSPFWINLSSTGGFHELRKAGGRLFREIHGTSCLGYQERGCWQQYARNNDCVLRKIHWVRLLAPEWEGDTGITAHPMDEALGVWTRQ